MAKRQPKVPVELTVEQKIEKAKADFFNYDCPLMSVQLPPSRKFDVGEKVKIGHLEDVTILEVLDGGVYQMAYVSSAMVSFNRDAPKLMVYRVDWWFNIEVIRDTSAVPRMMPEYRRYSPITGDIDSLMHLLNGGVVCDPEYQRGYVWTEADKDSLLDTIFERGTFGSFLFIRHAGFNHKGDSSVRTCKNLAGEQITIPVQSDYTVSIVDGQQRLTTIIDFVLDRRPYRGVYFSQMHFRDQIDFTCTSLTYTIINEEQVTRKEILRLFLQVNRGVPQQPEHLAKVQALYDKE